MVTAVALRRVAGGLGRILKSIYFTVRRSPETDSAMIIGSLLALGSGSALRTCAPLYSLRTCAPLYSVFSDDGATSQFGTKSYWCLSVLEIPIFKVYAHLQRALTMVRVLRGTRT